MDPAANLEEPEAARLRFRGFCYWDVASPQEALSRLRELCRQWLLPEVRSKEQMLELLVLEQFLSVLPPEIQAWVRGQQPGSPEKAAALVEGLQQEPEQLLGWITAHVLKREVLPAAQTTTEPLGSSCPSGTGEATQAAPGERPVLLHHCVKEEPNTDGQTAPCSPPAPLPPPEGHLRHKELASSTCPARRIAHSASSAAPGRQGSGHLPSQKELSWDVMLEKYGAVVSLAGLTAGDAQPGVIHDGSSGQGDLCSGPRSYTCNECGRSFSWKSQLVIHRKSHAGQRRHFCSDCGRGFDWKSQLVIHRKSHRPETS